MGPVPPPRPDHSHQFPADELTTAVLGPTEVATFENLYVAYRLDAHRLATRLLGDPERAADAVHTAFVEMLRYVLSGRRWYDPGDARMAVLRNTRWAALNIARDRRRRSEVTGDAGSDVPAVDDDWARVEIRGLCEEIVGRLPLRDRTAIHLHFVESLSNAEAGSRLNISPQAFQMRLSRALRSARRAARGMGASPAIGVVPLAVRPVRDAPCRRWRGWSTRMPPVPVPATALIVGVFGLLVAGIAVQAPQSTLSASSSGFTSPAQSRTSRARLDRIVDAAVVDLVAISSKPKAPTLLALGEGRSCACWIIYRSDDGGDTWAQTPGPATVPDHPRLDVVRAFPGDPRIFVTDGSTGRPDWQATAFGAPFVAAPDLGLTWHVAARAVDGRNQLAVAPGRALYVDPDGGLFCSTSGGTTWTRTCNRVPVP